MLPNQKLFDELGDKISQVVNQGPIKDIEHNLRALVQSTLQKLDIVTREEFDVQQEVLLRTREQLVVLESRVTELEKMITPPPAA